MKPNFLSNTLLNDEIEGKKSIKKKKTESIGLT
jgi:hypothetical protein